MYFSSVDPRNYQITVLASFLAYGVLYLHFDIPLLNIALTLTTAIALQFACSRAVGLTTTGYKSALISALSICLLLRTNYLLVLMVTTLVAISSKFFIRFRGKHIFNPTNLGIVIAVFFLKAGWISTGQWGSATVFAFLVACLGTWVVSSALRFDIATMFLLIYSGLLVSRALWLGDPLTIPLHQLSNGSLLIFAFFMISDPKTTPDSRPGRIFFALLVAYVAYRIRYTYYTPNALIYALALISPIVPLIDQIMPAFKFEWSHRDIPARASLPS